jgi:hypothetical protein
MKFVADENKLKYGEDVKLLTIGTNNSFVNYLSNNLNKTQYGIVFCLDNMDYVNNITIPCTFEFYNATFNLYTILYNVTQAPNGFLTSTAYPFPKYPPVL